MVGRDNDRPVYAIFEEREGMFGNNSVTSEFGVRSLERRYDRAFCRQSCLITMIDHKPQFLLIKQVSNEEFETTRSTIYRDFCNFISVKSIILINKNYLLRI